jgi:hypothetical protein
MSPREERSIEARCLRSARQVALPGRKQMKCLLDHYVTVTFFLQDGVFRNTGHSPGPEELEYPNEILKEHDISDEDVEM